MSTTPHVRLSESLLSQAILKFYTDADLIPPGVAVSAVEAVAGKMAYGLAKLVRHFRVLYSSAPDKGKNKAVSKLKERLQQENVAAKPERKASETDLDEVSTVSGNGINWKLLAEKVKEAKSQKSGSKSAPVEVAKRPVATPARAVQPLPAFVLDSLKRETEVRQVKPFATTSADGEDVKTEADVAEEKAVKSPSKTRKAEKNAGKKTKRQEHAEVEAALAGPSQALVPAEPVKTMAAYKPKDFHKMKVDFIAKVRKEEGSSHREAVQKWMLSSLRAEYLSSLPEKELKRRRFL